MKIHQRQQRSTHAAIAAAIFTFTLLSGFILVISKPATTYAQRSTAPYFSVESYDEMKRISQAATTVEYGYDYSLQSEKNAESIYRIVVMNRGYLTFTADNPYKSAYDGTLQTTLGLLEVTGNCLWEHKYDYNYEESSAHSYNIGLDVGVYYFYVRNNSCELKDVNTVMQYHFNLTETEQYEIEPNNTRAIAQDYSFGSTISGEYGCRVDDIISDEIADDYFRMYFVKDRGYDFTFSMQTKGLYRNGFHLEDSSGREIADSSDLSKGTYSYDCEKTGYYYLHITNGPISAVSIVQPYSFTVEEYFESPKTSISKIKRSGTSAVVKWKKKDGITAYQFQCDNSYNKVADAEIRTIEDPNVTSFTFTGLRKKKSYYVRVRTYTTANGKTVYSSWSKIEKIKKIKTKKARKSKK